MATLLFWPHEWMACRNLTNERDSKCDINCGSLGEPLLETVRLFAGHHVCGGAGCRKQKERKKKFHPTIPHAEVNRAPLQDKLIMKAWLRALSTQPAHTPFTAR